MEELVQAAQSGDPDAFTRLVERFQDKAFAVALAYLSDYHQAQDATQEAFVEAFVRLPQLKAPEAFWTWLRQIVRGKCARVIRPGKSAPARVSLTDAGEFISRAPTPEAVAIQVSTRQEVRHALRVLSEQERQALLLYAVGGFSYQEIADQMQLSLPLIKKRIYTARAQLRSSHWLEAVRPSDPGTLPAQVRARAESHLQQRKEKQMQAPIIPRVELVGPGTEYKTVIKNLYVFYRYDLMATFGEEPLPPDQVSDETWSSGEWVNQNGVINGLHSRTHDEGVRGEDQFWEWPNLQAFLIKLNGWPAGFALVASPPNATPGVDYRLQEFFVINKARRRGVGTQAARQLFARLPGKWELAYNPANPAAVALWKTVVPSVSHGSYHDQMIYVGSPQDLPGYNFTVPQSVVDTMPT